jgi:hypothetical protein
MTHRTPYFIRGNLVKGEKHGGGQSIIYTLLKVYTKKNNGNGHASRLTTYSSLLRYKNGSNPKIFIVFTKKTNQLSKA